MFNDEKIKYYLKNDEIDNILERLNKSDHVQWNKVISDNLGNKVPNLVNKSEDIANLFNLLYADGEDIFNQKIARISSYPVVFVLHLIKVASNLPIFADVFKVDSYDAYSHARKTLDSHKVGDDTFAKRKEKYDEMISIFKLSNTQIILQDSKISFERSEKEQMIFRAFSVPNADNYMRCIKFFLDAKSAINEKIKAIEEMKTWEKGTKNQPGIKLPPGYSNKILILEKIFDYVTSSYDMLEKCAALWKTSYYIPGGESGIMILGEIEDILNKNRKVLETTI